MPLRRPLVAVIAALVLVAVEALLDPTGLLALVGWSGAVPETGRGLWPFAPYAVFLPVFLAAVWWVALRAGERFWTLVVGVVLAVMLAQSAAAFAMTWDLENSAWASSYVLGKAVPAALVVAAFTRWFGGRGEKARRVPGSVVAPALLFAAVAPLVAGQWWTAVVYAPGTPVAHAASGAVSVVLATVILAAAAIPSIGWMRARVPGVLGGWLGAVVAGGALGVVQAVVAAFLDGMPSGDIWPLMALYVGLADGLSFGAALGWVAGVAGVLIDRSVARRALDEVAGAAGARQRALTVGVGIVSAGLVAVVLVVHGLTATGDPSRAWGEAIPIPGFLRADRGIITDGDGNQVLLRGVNVNQLVDFYAPRPEVPVTTPLTEQDFADIAAQGFDVVRLGFSWSALEPAKGQIDQAYLTQIKDAVHWAKAHGIYVVLDMHQDSWWNEGTPEGWSCRPGTDTMWGYDGAPTWATITDSAPRCQFQSRDISPASDRAFQNLYFDTDDVQGAMVQAWAALAKEFAGEQAVAGYDLLNEPGFGETAPVTTSLQLGRFYSRAIDAIRDTGANQIVFIEPSILWSGLGFDTGPKPSFSADPNIVFSPHLYSESITVDASLGLPPIVGMERQFMLGTRAAGDYETALWSGEYGFWGDTENRVSHLERYAALEDQYRIGGAYWVWKQACGDPQNGIQDIGDGLVIQDCSSGEFSGVNQPLLDILRRAYPQSAPGTLRYLDSHGAKMVMTGHAAARSCGLKVWVPAPTEAATSEGPALDTEGITGIVTNVVNGGWIITGCAEGDYSLSTLGG